MSWSSNDSLKLWVLILINGFSGVGKIFFLYCKIPSTVICDLGNKSHFSHSFNFSECPAWGWLLLSGLGLAFHAIYFPPYIFHIYFLRLRPSHTFFFPFLRGDEEMSLAPSETAAFSVLSQHVAVDMTPQQREKEKGRFERKYGGHCSRKQWYIECVSCRRQADLWRIEILNLLKYGYW